MAVGVQICGCLCNESPLGSMLGLRQFRKTSEYDPYDKDLHVGQGLFYGWASVVDCFRKLGSSLWVSLQSEPCYFGVYIRATDFWRPLFLRRENKHSKQKAHMYLYMCVDIESMQVCTHRKHIHRTPQ